MKITAIDVRPGTVLDDEGKLWLVSKIQINQPGKGASVIQVEMKDIKTGTRKTFVTARRKRLKQPRCATTRCSISIRQGTTRTS